MIGSGEEQVNPLLVKWHMVVSPAFRKMIIEKYPEKFYFAERLNFRIYGNVVEVFGNLDIMQTETHEIVVGEEKFKIILKRD